MARYRDGFQSEVPKYDFSLTSMSRALVLLIIPITAFTIGLLPITYSLIWFIHILDLTSFLHIIVFTLLLIVEFFLFIIFETFIPGLFIRIMRLKIDEGEHDFSIRNWNFFKYLLYFILYRPALKVVGILPLIPLRIRFLKLVGLKMGKTSVLAGSEIIHDPYMLEIGEQTLIGGWSQITGHLGEKKLWVKKVKIGNNCLIGGKSFIMPGVVIEDNVTLGLNSVVLKDQHLKKGFFYAGIPAKEIKRKEE